MIELKQKILSVIRRAVGSHQLMLHLEQIKQQVNELNERAASTVRHSCQETVLSNIGNTPLPQITSPASMGKVDTPGTTAVIEQLATRAAESDIPASAFVINYNEGSFAKASLLSLQRCKQVIFIDKGSTDGSEKSGEALATTSVSVPWSPTVETTRKEAEDLCQYEWRIFLDADEFVSPSVMSLLKTITELDLKNSFPFDIVKIQRINYLGGIAAKHNIYKPWSIPRIYRKGSYLHSSTTHEVIIAEGARVLEIAPEYGAHIVHFNQDNFYEYFEKMNRYTETYHTGYRSPSHPTDMFEFARAQIARAEASIKNHSGTLFDGAWELATAMYYVCEYLKQWERSQAVDLGRGLKPEP